MGKKLRVYELARELNLDNSEVIRELQHMGVPVTSHSNTVEDRLADQLRKKLGPAADEEPIKAGKTAKVEEPEEEIVAAPAQEEPQPEPKSVPPPAPKPAEPVVEAKAVAKAVPPAPPAPPAAPVAPLAPSIEAKAAPKTVPPPPAAPVAPPPPAPLLRRCREPSLGVFVSLNPKRR